MNEKSVDFISCENCGAPMKPVPNRDYFYCEYCSSFAFPEPSPDGVVVLGERGDVDCPICSTTLSTASVAEVRVLHCVECRGVMVEQEAFSTIVRFLRAQATGEPDPVRPVNREELEREIACPCCGRTMETHPYYGPGNVVIDNCARCELIWLDYGELAAIRDAPGRDRGRADEANYSFIEDLLGS
jgi:Zn-finger nucleic acid-binding protein